MLFRGACYRLAPQKTGDLEQGMIDLENMQRNARRASSLLKALSNEHRLMILCKLGIGEWSVGELEEVVGLSQSALSQHLARLRRDGLVRTRRDAQTIYYSLSDDEATKVIQAVYDVFCATPGDAETDAEKEPATVP